jgi:hypothetical protein
MWKVGYLNYTLSLHHVIRNTVADIVSYSSVASASVVGASGLFCLKVNSSFHFGTLFHEGKCLFKCPIKQSIVLHVKCKSARELTQKMLMFLVTIILQILWNLFRCSSILTSLAFANFRISDFRKVF